MKKRSIKSNAFFNSMKEFLNIAAPFITFPYVTRVLMPDNLGKVQFAASIITVFTYFASLGIPFYGVRRIAQVRDNMEQRSRVFRELLLIEIIATFVVYGVFLLSLVYVEEFNREMVLYLIMGTRIVLKIFGFEWFFKGMEEYKFMAYRKLLAKVVGIILIFTFIKTPDDYVLYGSVSVITLVISRILNYWNLKKLIVKVPLKELKPSEHFAKASYFFLLYFSTKLYHNVDKIMLGFISGHTSVGFYVTANKLINIIKTVFISFTAVLIPRFTNLVYRGKWDKLKPIAQKSLQVIFFLSFPAMIGLYLLSHEIIMVFGGEKYLSAVMTMRVLLPIMVILPLSSFVGKQLLISMNKDRIVISTVFASLLLNVLLNAFLIPRYQQNGAAAASVAAELFILIVEITWGWQYLKRVELKIRPVFIYILASAVMSVFVYFLKTVFLMGLPSLPIVLISSAAGAAVYTLFLIIVKESIFVPMIGKMIRKRLPTRT
jgi:O-antigen/teichoic acid export membrane protein